MTGRRRAVFLLLIGFLAGPKVEASPCVPLTLTSMNLIGALSYSSSEDLESVRVIYRVGERETSVSFFLLKADLPAFRHQVDVILRGDSEGDGVLKLNRERLSDGSCFTTRDRSND